MNENITHEEALVQVVQYFADQLEIEITDHKMDLEALADFHGITLYQAMVLCCNLEDVETMEELIGGEGIEAWLTFDPWDAAIFNDSYEDMMEQLGLIEDEEDSSI